MDPKVFSELQIANNRLESNFSNYSKKLVGRNKKWDQFDKQYPGFLNKPTLIKLNVGGYKFLVNEALLYSENNNFKKVVSEGVQTENNEVFIDRPGRNFQFILDYLSYISLTYVVIFCFVTLLVLVAGSPFEASFIKMLLITLQSKETSVTLNTGDIMNAFFIWWLILGTFFKIVKELLGVNFNKTVLPLVLFITLVSTLLLTINIGSSFVPIFLFGLFIVNFIIYYSLSRISEITRNFIR